MENSAENNLQRMPIDFMFDLLDDPTLEEHYQIPLENCWLAAAKRSIPVFTPGFEDSTLGNIASRVIDGSLPGHGAIAGRSNGETRTLVPIDLRSITHWLLSNRRNRGRFSHLRGPDAGARSQRESPPMELLLSNHDAVTSYGAIAVRCPMKKSRGTSLKRQHRNS